MPAPARDLHARAPPTSFTTRCRRRCRRLRHRRRLTQLLEQSANRETLPSLSRPASSQSASLAKVTHPWRGVASLPRRTHVFSARSIVANWRERALSCLCARLRVLIVCQIYIPRKLWRRAHAHPCSTCQSLATLADSYFALAHR